MFSAILLNRFEVDLSSLFFNCLDLVFEIMAPEESFGYVISRSCSRSFSMIFATITDGLACGGPIIKK